MFQSKDKPPNIDPLDTLTKEQSTELKDMVLKNINTFSQSNVGRPTSSAWTGYEIYMENVSNPLFERMAWEILNDNFKKMSTLDISIVSHTFDYFYDFHTPEQDGSNMLIASNKPWLKTARKNLTEYLLHTLETNDLKNDTTAEYFTRLNFWAQPDNPDFQNGRPDKGQNHREWRRIVDMEIIKAKPALLRLKQTL
jgi:hypothetical protein